MGQDYPLTLLAANGLRLGAGEFGQDTRVMTNTTNKEDPLMFSHQFLQVVSHIGFTQKVLPG